MSLPMYTRTRAHTHTHTHTRSRTHTHTHKRMHTPVAKQGTFTTGRITAQKQHIYKTVCDVALLFSFVFCKLFSSSASVGRKEAHRTSNRVRIFLALARLLSESLLLWIRFLTTTVRCSRLVVSQRRENRYSRIFWIVFGQTRQNQTLSGIRPPMLKQGGRGKNSNPPPTLVGGLHFMILVPNPICFDSYDCLISEETYFTGEGKINTFTKLFAIWRLFFFSICFLKTIFKLRISRKGRSASNIKSTSHFGCWLPNRTVGSCSFLNRTCGCCCLLNRTSGSCRFLNRTLGCGWFLSRTWEVSLSRDLGEEPLAWESVYVVAWNIRAKNILAELHVRRFPLYDSTVLLDAIFCGREALDHKVTPSTLWCGCVPGC